MKLMFRLAWVIIRGNGFGSLTGDASQKRRRLRGAGSIALFIFLIGYLAAVVSGSAMVLVDLLLPYGLEALVTSLYVSAGVILTFFLGTMYALSIFYYASDVDKLLPLPLRAEQIIGAKFIVTALYEYLFLVVLILPPLIVYGVRTGAAPFYYLVSLLVFALLPLVPLALATILTMLIMRFTPLARNKDRFNMLSSLLLMALSLAFVFASQNLASRPGADLASFFSQNAEKIAAVTASVFPGTQLAVRALVTPAPGTALLNLGSLALMALAALALMLLGGRLLYFRGVIGLGSASSKRRRLTAEEWRQAGRSRSAFWTYVIKDTLVLVRTPIFFLNNVLMNFLWPAFLVLPLLGDASGEISLAQIRTFIAQASQDPGTVPTALIMAIAFGAFCFVTGTNGITASALSREGRQFYIMKFIPMSYGAQIRAKIMTGILITLAGLFLTLLLAVILLRPPLWLVGLILLVIPGAILLPSLAGIVFELYWPKLQWENEQKAVKQNLNVVYSILISLLLAGLVLAPVIAWQPTLPVALLLTVLMPLALSAGIAFWLARHSSSRMQAIDV